MIISATNNLDMKHRIRKHQDRENKENPQEELKEESTEDWARADDDGFAQPQPMKADKRLRG